MKKEKAQKEQPEPQDEMSRLKKENQELKKRLASIEEETLILKNV